MSFFGKNIYKILSRIQTGDERAKEELFYKTYSHLKAVACRYLRDKNDAEDVLSNAYLKVFSSIHAFNRGKDGYNWLCKIVQNEAYDFNKKATADLPIEEEIVGAEQTALDEALAQSDEIWRWLKDYDERDRKIIYLKFWEEYSYAEIAQALGMKKSNVHKRVSKIIAEILEKNKNQVDD